jgi:hypothetical protein
VFGVSPNTSHPAYFGTFFAEQMEDDMVMAACGRHGSAQRALLCADSIWRLNEVVIY